MKFATRVNSFVSAGYSITEVISEMGKIEGLTHVDLNYPEHFQDTNKKMIYNELKRNNLKLNAISMRFRNEFINGEFGNKNNSISDKAIQLCKEGIDICKEFSGNQVIVWLGFDGYDYPFQIEYVEYWNKVVTRFKEICDYSDIAISIEYKPYEERTHALIDSLGTTMMMLMDVGKDNLGVTMDYCHLLMKKENPSFSASYLLSNKKLFGVHLNDGEGSVDDGLMVGMASPLKLLELLYYLKKYSYEGVIFFDTFPKREVAIEECKQNIAMCKKMLSVIERLGMSKIKSIIDSNNGIEVSKMLQNIYI